MEAGGGDSTAACPNLLPKRMMEPLAAVCDTLLPAIGLSDAADPGIADFYATSASVAGTPELVGGLICGGVEHPAIWLLRLALWLLSTWYGTFVLCGRRSLSSQFPYFQRFSRVDRKRREEILVAWSLSSVTLLAMLFRCLKYLTLREYFTQLTDDKANPAWRAMGYCGPDPDFVDRSQESSSKEEDFESDPLDSALLRMDSPRRVVLQKLHAAGFLASPGSTSSTLTISCDAVVIGSGSGGSVVAGVLAKAGHKVIVLEKGRHFPRRRLSLLEGPSVRAMYEGGGLIATDEVDTLFLAGSTVGGGSTVNWSASIRTPEHVRREWCDLLGLGLFGSEAYDRALDAVCDRMGVQSDVAEEGFSNLILRKGCEALGLPLASVPCNAPRDHYCGWCHLGCKSGKKKSTKVTWLADLAESGNGLVLPGCKAVRILHRGDTGLGRSAAKGVDATCGGDSFTVEAKVTVVACGALNTPGLLKQSGLKNAHIGKHLHIHPVVMAWGYFPTTRWPEESKKSYKGGILTTMCPLSTYSEASGYGTLLQTPALHPGMFATVTPWVSAEDFRKRMTRFSRTAHVFALLRDKSEGVTDYPKQLRYRLEKEDEDKLKSGLETALRVLAGAGAEEVGTQHAKGERVRVGLGGAGVEAAVREVWSKGLKDGRILVCSAHQMGSCRMAGRAGEGVVAPDGETWEAEGLYVADTSVFPTALGVNPMVTVQAIAYCTAQSILQVLRGKKRGQ